jgi:hypothetical protein
VATLESHIDELYKGPLSDFITARSALAKTLTGAEAKQVKALVKPTVVPWTVNQVHWHARDVYGRVMKAGEKLRDAQLAALKGRTADVRGATVVHRQAIADAVKAAGRLASEAGAHPDPEPLARMFEAVSLQAELPEPHGRFTKPLQPQGFEALTGVAIKPSSIKPSPQVPHAKRSATTSPDISLVPSAAERAEQTRREREEALAARQKETAIRKAEAEVARARTAEAHARAIWDRAKNDLEEAERTLKSTRGRTVK